MAYSDKKNAFFVISGQFANDFIYISEKVTSKIHWTIDSQVTKNVIQGKPHIDGLMQERRNSTANILELCLSCTNPSILCNFPEAL